MFRSCCCRTTSFWLCCVAVCVVECILTLSPTYLFFQTVLAEPMLQGVPHSPLGVVCGYFSGECALKCRQGWASGDLSSSFISQGSVGQFSQYTRVTALKVTPPGIGGATAPVIAPPGAGRVEAESQVVRVSGSHCCCYFCSSTDALSQCGLDPLPNWCCLPVSPLNIFLRTIFDICIIL